MGWDEAVASELNCDGQGGRAWTGGMSREGVAGRGEGWSTHADALSEEDKIKSASD